MPPMPTQRDGQRQEPERFFRIIICNETVVEHFNLNFSLLKHDLFTLTELDNMLGYEREIYTNLLIADIKKQNEKNNA